MNDELKYKQLAERLSDLVEQQETLGRELSDAEDQLTTAEQEYSHIKRAFNNGMNCIRGRLGTTETDVEWHGRSWGEWEIVLSSYQAKIPKLMQTVFNKKFEQDRLFRQERFVREQMSAIRFKNRYEKPMVG